ncbi:8-amino-7-oxononanoate synthase [Nitrincola iocasae]|uniref:8-amino-7-oxononanoate synthase n=1 Tax=Nitrincola iocasae TaxID=2614693 RepID=A0A5J6LAU5_9GAMM|nr:8-amino-7-oxononanoate synthase [Nitrincola iocasae]QEW05610.1 8-amino-7-oxononanoate synthase [Nitrincola iocasae]
MDSVLRLALEDRRQQQLYRQRQVIHSSQQPERMLGHQPVLSFCSNDYLGLAADPRVADAMIEGTQRYGVGSGASHLTAGHTDAHHQLELELAAFTGRERALLFSSGYMANLGVMTALAGRRDAVFHDRLNHASLLDGALLSGARFRRFPHLDTTSLERMLQTSQSQRRLVVTDGVFSMDGDQADLGALAALCQTHQAWLVVDDAHGFGVLGAQGGGSAAVSGLMPEALPVLVGTLGKAFGTAGAFVAGSEALIETLIQFSRSYIYTTGLPPAVAEATRTSLALVQTEDWRRQHLQQLIQHFRQSCTAAGMCLLPSETAIQPLLIGCAGKAVRISEQLLSQGLLVTAIRPPTVPAGSARLRVTLTATHTIEQVDRLVSGLKQVMESHDVAH